MRAAHWLPERRRGSDQIRYEPQVPVSWVIENANRKKDARQRIKDALEAIEKHQRPFTTVELQETAQCSRTTLYKHADIWRQSYEDLASGFFANCTHEYNAVGRAASSESKPSSTTDSEIMPPGRLAARRIVFEITMRAQRERTEKVKEIQSLDQTWHKKVETHTATKAADLDIGNLKAVIAVLLFLCSLAPTEEDYNSLRVTVTAYQNELSARTQSSELSIVGRAPP